LALCDASTLTPDTDVVDTDIVYQNFVAENCMIHYNRNQKWHYLAEQQDSEILVFKAADSDFRTHFRKHHPESLTTLSVNFLAQPVRMHLSTCQVSQALVHAKVLMFEY
jgi:hypothetical protein